MAQQEQLLLAQDLLRAWQHWLLLLMLVLALLLLLLLLLHHASRRPPVCEQAGRAAGARGLTGQPSVRNRPHRGEAAGASLLCSSVYGWLQGVYKVAVVLCSWIQG
jgi:hypothetical protein